MSSSSSQNRFYLPPQPPPQSFSKGIGKRPSTATLAQSSDVLLPATRPIPTFRSDGSISALEFPDSGKLQPDRRSEFMSSSAPTGKSASDEVAGEFWGYWRVVSVGIQLQSQQ